MPKTLLVFFPHSNRVVTIHYLSETCMVTFSHEDDYALFSAQQENNIAQCSLCVCVAVDSLLNREDVGDGTLLPTCDLKEAF